MWIAIFKDMVITKGYGTKNTAKDLDDIHSFTHIQWLRSVVFHFHSLGGEGL